ncbi:hypothetical protein C3Y87_10025 [Carbonactinospora thermoautotrophica]|uniref:SMI1/KNR4 family protein n=1 Tax=Carbonactinospora thermoautotrophica TaxID=1469144 RepID=UPI00226FFB6D|nr:SMI1/KNR4 family protein [Carbonactinospora thermoautotrophica]MCX9191746.1 hypothetical protein [Carbonactinospora thermoautotrophica]
MSEHSGWPALIGAMILVKNSIEELDPEHLQEYTLPKKKATEEEIQAAERQLGGRLPEEYRDFLLHANGWRAFYWTVDLFGTPELLG